jgi:hypothetical protein
MRRAYGVVVCLLMCAGELPLLAQIGGPYPGGQYPGGGYPPGTRGPGGIPLPRRKSKTTQEKDTPAPMKEVEGMLRKADSKSIVVEAPDSRLITIKRDAKTRFLKNGEDMQPGDLKPGDHLRIEVMEDDEGFYYAVNVNFEKAGTAEERANASQPVNVIVPSSKDSSDDRPVMRRGGRAANESAADDPDRPVMRRSDPAPAGPAKAEPPQAAPAAPAAKPASPPQNTAEAASDEPPPVADILNQPKPPAAPRDPDDPGPPKVARGKPPASRRAADDTQPIEVASAHPVAPTNREPETETVTRRAPAAQERHDPVIEKAREMAGQFTETLPDYVCQEYMARFVNTSHTINWQPQDVVSTEVVYEHGKESYRNIAINSKPVKKGLEQLGGAWSTGEFGTLLIDLFSPTTAADFRYRRESTASGRTALVYSFDVQQPRSHWNVISASQNYRPAYRGTVWIDKRTYRVLRIEMQAYGMPPEFPLDKVESATDYDFVRFGGEQQFLMPVHAETLSCQRGTSQCSMNKIDFRNYHKYAGESVITFGSQKPEPEKKK